MNELEQTATGIADKAAEPGASPSASARPQLHSEDRCNLPAGSLSVEHTALSLSLTTHEYAVLIGLGRGLGDAQIACKGNLTLRYVSRAVRRLRHRFGEPGEPVSRLWLAVMGYQLAGCYGADQRAA
jgi:DNA-binding NarL/FixJ family response regulator